MLLNRRMTHNNNNWTAQSLKAAMAAGISYIAELAELSHDDFVGTVERHGGRYIRFSNHGNFAVIVVGGAGLPVLSSGEPMALPPGRLISESEFSRLLEVPLASDDDRLYTPAMLADLLSVPQARIDAWAKAGLIKPVRADRGIMRFEFRQAAVARSLSALAASGVTIDRLRRTLRQLQQRMPDLREPLQQLTILEHNGPLLVRLESGDLAEITGQLQLDYDNEPQPRPAQLRLVPKMVTAVDWHDQAVEQERAGMLQDAEKSYRQALIVGGPDSQRAFDLASVLTKLGKLPQAIERYRQVIELEPNHPDAWNNLGILLADSGEIDEACDAFRHALGITPDDPKMHYNLADALDTMGFAEEARQHWRAYLGCDASDSPWADHARQRLRALGG
jgi:tetratricopeptide (TPR) repeat protein